MKTGSLLGHAVKRTEDPALLRGLASYTEDIPAEESLHVAFVRSPFAHAKVGTIDTSSASQMPGVVGVYTRSDLDVRDRIPRFSSEIFARPALAKDKVRYAGQPIAVVVADSRAQALDATELVFPELEPLAVTTDPASAPDPGATALFEEHGSNVAWTNDFEHPPFDFGAGDVVVAARFINQRVNAVPMEPNSILARPGEGGTLKIWLPCQAPFWARADLAACLGIDEELLHIIIPSVGGGFGAKVLPYPEHVVVAAVAIKLGRAVRYTETRSENMIAMNHGRAQVQDVELGATPDGRLTGLRVRVIQDGGAYPDYGCYLPELTFEMACGNYRIPRIQFNARCVTTNTTPTGPYRGAGRPEATALIERAMDMLARQLDIDPVELRRKNFIPPQEFPYTTPTGAVYDTGEYERALDEVLRLSGYEQLRVDQARRREENSTRLLGIGISCYVEVTGFEPEYASVEVLEGGIVEIITGVAPHGQGLETALAQVAASVLSLPISSIRVRHSDTGVALKGQGTWGSRSLQKGGSAVFRSAGEVLAKAKDLASHLLEVDPSDIHQGDDGDLHIAGAPTRSISWAELKEISQDPQRRPPGMEPGLRSALDFQSERNTTYPFGAHVAVVEVDSETGRVKLLRMVAVDDCGSIINPMIVEGQIHGGLAQGIAQALTEEILYDELGNPMNGNLALYGIPSAGDLPAFEIAATETPTTMNPLGAKGVGESGTIGAAPAVQNAVVDALSHLGVEHIDMPLTPERVWLAAQSASRV